MINVYSIMMIAIVLMAVLMRGTSPQNRKFIFLACVYMFIIMGLRDVRLIGNDSRTSYLYSFRGMEQRSLANMLRNYDLDSNSGFYIFMKLIHTWTGGDYQAFVAIISAFFLICLANLVYRYSPDPLQSFCYYWGLLLFLFMFSAQKQAMAMSILTLAFDAIVKRKPIRFLLLVALSIQFHYPSLVFLPSYWLYNLKPGKYLIFLYILIVILTYTFRDQILTFMMNAYREDNEIQEYSLAGETFLRTKAVIMLVIIVSSLILRRPRAEDKVYLILMKFVAVSVIFQTFCAFNNVFERLADYYFQFSVVFIPMVFDKNAETDSLLSRRLDLVVKTFAPYLFCGFGIWRMASAVVGDSTHFLPYRFYF